MTLHDFIADEMRDLASHYEGKTRAEAEPKIRKAIAGFLTDLARIVAPYKTDVTTEPTPGGGIDINVTTNDPMLIERMANAGAIEDPSALGMIAVGDGWMWPPRVIA